jgi:class 3 adenylate cyclase
MACGQGTHHQDRARGRGLHSTLAPPITAGQAILAGVERDGLVRKGLLVGAGVHPGEAFVGTVGSDEKIDFTALGDTVNIAARLGGVAGPGELLVSRAAWDRATLGTPPAEREVEIAGRAGSLAVVAVEPTGDPVAEPVART